MKFYFIFQINLMTDRKLDLEKRVNALQGEREGLSCTLDESADRIVMLEKQTREQDHIVSDMSSNDIWTKNMKKELKFEIDTFKT